MLSAPKISEMWTPEEKAAKTLAFIGMSGLKYFDVIVKIKAIADNAAVVVDSGGMHRVITWRDMSFASEYVARQNLGAVVLLKIRQWT